MKRPYITTIVVLGALVTSQFLAPSTLGAEIYRYVDANGHIHLTDRPNNPLKKGEVVSQQASATEILDSEKIFRFVDSNGVVHLTDRPKDASYQPFNRQNIFQPYPSYQFDSGGSYGVNIHRKYAEYRTLVSEVAEKTGLESALLHAVIQAESAYNPYARSPKGAVGLMQLMPGTAARYGVTDRTDATSSLYGGANYLSDLLRMFNYNKQLAIAGYNAGENAVKRYGYQIPPYRETQNYVKRVLALYEKYLSKTDR
jgi:membrane-bound lytic murein transglycosylase B